MVVYTSIRCMASSIVVGVPLGLVKPILLFTHLIVLINFPQKTPHGHSII